MKSAPPHVTKRDNLNVKLLLRSHYTLNELHATPKLNASSISSSLGLNNADKQQALGFNAE